MTEWTRDQLAFRRWSTHTAGCPGCRADKECARGTQLREAWRVAWHARPKTSH